MENTDFSNDVISVAIDSIVVGDRKRDLVEARVDVLKDSIAEIGLMQPIVVNEDMVLIAGRHRLEACRRLGLSEVTVHRKRYESVDAELAEIDENLVRFELTDLERSIQYARRKVLYGQKYPKPQADGKKKSPVKSFIEDTAEKTGRSTTTIRDETNLGERLVTELSPEVRGLIAQTKVATNKKDLQRLLDEPDEEVRLQAAKTINENFKDGVSVSVTEAIASVSPSPTPKAVEDGEEILLKALRKNEKLLNSSVNNPEFERSAESWTTEGLIDIREEFLRIDSLVKRGVDILTEIIDRR